MNRRSRSAISRRCSRSGRPRPSCSRRQAASIRSSSNSEVVSSTSGSPAEPPARTPCRPRRLYAKLTSLAGYIGRSGFPPTSQQLQVLEIYRGRLAEVRKRLAELRSGDLVSLNTQLAAEGFGKLVSGLWWQEPSAR